MGKNKDEIDGINERILQELIKDSSRSYRKLAAKVGVSPATLVERVKTLERKGYIQGYGARINYDRLGFEFMAVVEVYMRGKDLLGLEGKIARLPHVAAVWDTTGECDALAVVMCKSRRELSATVKKIVSFEGVRRTNTNIVLNVVSRLTEFGEV